MARGIAAGPLQHSPGTAVGLVFVFVAARVARGGWLRRRGGGGEGGDGAAATGEAVAQEVVQAAEEEVVVEAVVAVAVAGVEKRAMHGSS
ncbi:hypothetical protein TRIUR3_14344 [Triticum urartu]|uniref:Uncharacterized protein n=1 Tax=Triticum urartu TaxID=4572 RepID=M8A4A8_TRIUA|nr:hypothetical protein TRIUR3_14344 [Triticum urartu]